MKLAGEPPAIQHANKLPLDIIADCGNPFLVDMSELDGKILAEGKHGLLSLTEKKERGKNCEENGPSQHSFYLGQDHYADNQDRVKGEQNKNEHKEVPCSISFAAVDTEVPYAGAYYNPFLVDMFQMDDENAHAGKYGLVSPVECKNFEEERSSIGMDSSQYCYSLERERLVNDEDSINVGKDSEVTSYSTPAKVHSDFYADKTVNNSELEICQGTTAVKDICVDEGLLSLEKIVIENKPLDEKIHSDLCHSTTDRDHSVTKETTNSAMSSSYNLKSSVVNGHSTSVFDKNAVKESFSGSSAEPTDESGAPYQVVDNVPSEKTSSKQLFPMDKFDVDPLQAKSSSSDWAKDLDQSCDQEKISQDEKGSSTVIIVHSASKEFKPSNELRVTPAEVESGVITFDFDSAEAMISGRVDNKENKASQPVVHAIQSQGIDDNASDGANASARISFFHHSQGDSGVSGPNFLSGPIVSSGHMPFSGNISHRSDSSTTSAHSFAFPILQTEWNSSPVKMAKADRRQFRKQRCWRIGFLCCRF